MTSLPEEVNLKSYIVRIYRQEQGNPGKLVGTVEEPPLTGKRAFTDLDELWEILNPGTGRKSQGSGSGLSTTGKRSENMSPDKAQ